MEMKPKTTVIENMPWKASVLKKSGEKKCTIAKINQADIIE